MRGSGSGKVCPPDFDFVGTFVEAAHDAGLEIYGSFNTFAEGNGAFRRGLIYDGHPEWQAVNYVPAGDLPQLGDSGRKVLFANPALPAVQVTKSPFSRKWRRSTISTVCCSTAAATTISSPTFGFYSREIRGLYRGGSFPRRIYTWEEDGDGGWKRIDGPYFKQWIEWRASVIYDFFKRTKEELKAVKPGLKFGALAGAWYPSYFEVGVNWASNTYDPSQDFAWATPGYKNYGYAELLDIFTNGNYYWNVTVDEYRRSNGLHKNETDSEMSKGDHLSVEGGCRYSRRLLGGRPFFGGMYVEDYKRDTTQFKRAVEMNLRESDGWCSTSCISSTATGGDRCSEPSAPMKRRRSNEQTVDFCSAGAVVRRRRFRPEADGRRLPRRPKCAMSDVRRRRRRREFRLERNQLRVPFYAGGSLAMRVSDTKKNYYNLTVDGRDAGVVTTFGTDSVVVLAEKLGRGEHTVRMQKRTEGEQGRTTIHAFLLDRGGRLLPASPAPGRHIEFIGNSLTCGYGTEGLSKDEPFKPQTENCNKAYACIIARYFGADYTLIAHSGRGAARNYGDKNTTSQNTMADRIANTFDEAAGTGVGLRGRRRTVPIWSSSIWDRTTSRPCRILRAMSLRPPTPHPADSARRLRRRNADPLRGAARQRTGLHLYPRPVSVRRRAEPPFRGHPARLLQRRKRARIVGPSQLRRPAQDGDAADPLRFDADGMGGGDQTGRIGVWPYRGFLLLLSPG